MAPGAASPVDFTTAYISAAITYSSRQCQPSPTPECTMWRGTSFSAPSDYVTMAEYNEALRSTYIVDDDDTSFTFDVINATNMLSDINEWRSAILTAVPQSVASMDPAIVAASEGLSSEAWVQSLPSEVRRYYMSAYLPQFTTRMVYHEFVAPTRSIALPSDSIELRGIVSYEFGLAALRIAETGVAAATAAPIPTAAAGFPSITGTTTPASTATISGLNGAQAAEAPSGRGSINSVIAMAVSIPIIIVVSAICRILYCCWKKRQRRRQKEPTFERARRASSHQIDYNAAPVYPHKPLQHLSETSFGSTSEPEMGLPVNASQHPPRLPPLPEMGEGGMILAGKADAELA